MKILTALICVLLTMSAPTFANYERNKAQPVQQVLFGTIKSVRHITEQELVRDKSNGWKTFGGALIGGAIGNQFGGGSGRTIATILGSLIGGQTAHNSQQKSHYKQSHLVELLIKVQSGKQFMVVQELDNSMLFNKGDSIRLVYLSDNTVRVDKAY